MITEEGRAIKRTLTLKASRTRIWDALTNPEKTKQYMFNCEVMTDWKVGHAIQWKGNYQGYESGERGIIVECKQKEVLKYTSFDPNFGLEDVKSNYLVITYRILPFRGLTRLITTIENYNQDPERLAHVAQGWDNIVLPNLKMVIERQAL